MIPLKLFLLIVGIVLILLLILRKSKGLRGTWDNKNDIQEYAILMSDDTTPEKPLKKSKRNYDLEQLANVDNTVSKDSGDSIGEKISRYHLEKTLNKKFPKTRPDFLKNPITNTNLELDCFCEDLKLALEYNGKQHYEFVPKFHKTKNDFYNQKYRDEIKKRLCYENGIDLIEVPYKISHDEIPLYIDASLEKLGRIKFTMR